jgi:glycosyltransferase 2 family protein
MQKKKLLVFIRWAITLLLLAYVFQKAGLFKADSRQQFFDLVLSADIGMFLLSIAIGLVGNISCAIKWFMLLKSREIKVSLMRIYGYHMVGRFFNLVLPTSMGGDVVRLHELGRFTGQRAEAVASVFVERFTGMITLFFVAGVTVILNRNVFSAPIIVTSLVLLIPVIGLLYWFLIDERPLGFVANLVGNRTRVFEPLFVKIRKFQNAVEQYGSDNSAILFAFINSVIFYIIAVLNVWVGALAFTDAVSFQKIFIAVPVILLIMNIPLSIGGLGLMEFAYAFTFELVGYDSALALSVALLMRLKSFIDAFIGGIIYLLINRGRSITNEINAGLE